MIKNFQLLIHQVLDSVELNEKAFRDLGSECAYSVPEKTFASN